MGVEEEDGAFKVDEGFELFCFFTGAVVDLHDDFPHVGGGDVAEESGIGHTEDEAADFPPFFDQLDVLDRAIGEVDGLHFTFPSGEDVALHAPREVYVVGQEAEFANDFFLAEGVSGRAVEGDVDGVSEHYDSAGILGLREDGLKLIAAFFTRDAGAIIAEEAEGGGFEPFFGEFRI